jgi:hypothetical protein
VPSAKSIQAPPVQAEPKTLDRPNDTSHIAAAAKIGHPTRTETEEDRQRDKRIAAFMQRPDIQAAVRANAAMAGAIASPNDRTVSRAA